MLVSCRNRNEKVSTLPESMFFSLPNSISDEKGLEAHDILVDIKNRGKFVKHKYQLASHYLYEAELAAKMLDHLAQGLQQKKIHKALEETYLGDDRRTKQLIVEEGASIDGRTWAFKATIKDIHTGVDTAMQVFWNDAESGATIILHPYILDRLDFDDASIKYKGSFEYDGDARVMTIEKSEDNFHEKYGVRNYLTQFRKNANGTECEVKAYFEMNAMPFPKYVRTSEVDQGGVDSVELIRNYFVRGVAHVNTAYTNLELSSLPTDLLDLNNDNLDSFLIDSFVVAHYYEAIDLSDSSLTTSLKQSMQDTLEMYLEEAGVPVYYNDNGYHSAGETRPGPMSGLNLSLEDIQPFTREELDNFNIRFQ